MTIPTSAKLVSTAGNQSIWAFGDYNVSYAYGFPVEDLKKLDGLLIKSGFVQGEVEAKKCLRSAGYSVCLYFSFQIAFIWSDIFVSQRPATSHTLTQAAPFNTAHY